MKGPHLFDPKKIDVLETEDRKIWQNPEEILRTIEIKCARAILRCAARNAKLNGVSNINLSGLLLRTSKGNEVQYDNL